MAVKACLLANVEFAGAHFGEISVVWGMKIADFGAVWARCLVENGEIVRKSHGMRLRLA